MNMLKDYVKNLQMKAILLNGVLSQTVNIV